MAGAKAHSWKVLGLGKTKAIAEKTEKHLQEIGYKNAKVIALENDKASDDTVIELLKENDWDGVCFGEYTRVLLK
jgi:methenyltetrahydromethanopterin cyclohydrolase